MNRYRMKFNIDVGRGRNQNVTEIVEIEYGRPEDVIKAKYGNSLRQIYQSTPIYNNDNYRSSTMAGQIVRGGCLATIGTAMVFIMFFIFVVVMAINNPPLINGTTPAW